MGSSIDDAGAGAAGARPARRERIWRDSTVSVLREGYPFLARRRTELESDVVPLRMLGRRGVALCGPAWVELFYDKRLVQRHGAVPEPVRSTLFGHGAVQSLDGAMHRARRALFLEQLDDGAVAELRGAILSEWLAAESRWHRAEEVVLFDEAARVLLAGVWRWCGLPALDESAVRSTSADMVAMVDGFASIGSRHLRARLARRRQERLLEGEVESVRRRPRPAASVVAAVSNHRDQDGQLLPARTAAVELLNIIRPTVAITWYLTFAAHAMQTWPATLEGLLSDDRDAVIAFVDEVRRYYPFAPFIGGLARQQLVLAGHPVRPGQLVLLDLYGQNHHPGVWDEPEVFDPERFRSRTSYDVLLVPQGGGDPVHGHRCPGEPLTVQVLADLVVQLARLSWRAIVAPEPVRLDRIPTRPASGMPVWVG